MTLTKNDNSANRKRVFFSSSFPFIHYTVKQEQTLVVHEIPDTPKEHEAWVYQAVDAEPGSIEWVAEASEAEYQAFLNKLFIMVDEGNLGRALMSSNDVKENEKVTQGAMLSLKASIDIAKSIKRSDFATNTTISEFLMDTVKSISRLLIAVKSNSYAIGHANSKEFCDQAGFYYGILYELLQSENSIELPIIEEWKQMASSAKVVKPSTNNIELYNMSTLPAFHEIGRRFEELQSYADAIDTAFLDTEDRFLLKDITDSYFANIYTAAVSLKDSDASTIEEVEKDFSTQLDFIESELKRIKANGHKQAIELVKNQTGFVVSKMNENKSISQLS
jgi:hypothetical protein